MVIKFYKPITPGTRTRAILDYSDLSKVNPQKALTKPKPKSEPQSVEVKSNRIYAV